MALGSKSLHCILLFLHLFVMIVALTVLVVSAVALAELMDKRSFLEGNYKAKPAVTSEVDVWPPARIIGDPMEKEEGAEDEGSPQGTVTGPPILIVATASASLLLSAFGFYSTLKMNVYILRAFIVLMAAVLLLQTSSGIWSFVARSRCVESIRVSLIRQLTEYEVGATGRSGRVAKAKGASQGWSVSPATTLWAHPWDALQWQMKCCGVEGPDDYIERGAIPLSCCAPAVAAAALEMEDVEGERPPLATTPSPGFSCHTIRRNGCLDSLDGYVRGWLLWVGIFAIAATFVEVIPLMLTFAYTISIRRDLQRIYQ